MAVRLSGWNVDNPGSLGHNQYKLERSVIFADVLSRGHIEGRLEARRVWKERRP